MLSPQAIQVFLHYATSKALYPMRDADWYEETLTGLIRLGLLDRAPRIQENGEVLNITETPLGKAYRKLLCQTPIPTISYIDPRTGCEVPG